jgi:hypothetical protein
MTAIAAPVTSANQSVTLQFRRTNGSACVHSSIAP